MGNEQEEEELGLSRRESEVVEEGWVEVENEEK